jgi:hypothetical protein
MIGSMRTILHMTRCDDLVSLIDDPACQLEDEIIVIPQGINPEGFIMDSYVPNGIIPRYFIQKYLGFAVSQTVRIFPAFDIPSAVTGDLTTCRIQDMYPNARPQCLPESVQTVRLVSQKSSQKFATAVDNAFGSSICGKSGLSFRGLSLRALALSLNFFIPVIGSVDNEFGPGIYTSTDFTTAYDYSMPNGAIMVFKNTDTRDLKVWRPNPDEWNHLVSTWVGSKNAKAPPNYKHADIITGAMSRSRGEGRKKTHSLQPDPGTNQSAYVSYKSCERLMSSLTAIIYMGR